MSKPTHHSRKPSATDLFDRMSGELTSKESSVAGAVAATLDQPALAGNDTQEVSVNTTETRDAETAVVESTLADGTSTSETSDTSIPADSDQNLGHLSGHARRALVRMLQHGVILASQNPRLYEALLVNVDAIRHHLADMYLSLMIDERAELAIIKQQTTDDLESEEEGADMATLIKRRPLTLYDSIVLVVLRKHFQQRETVGETRVIVEREQIAAQLAPFLKISNNSRIDRKKLNGSLDKFESHKIVAKIRGDADRIEITPVIRYVVGADFLTQLEAEYLSLVTDDMGSTDSANAH